VDSSKGEFGIQGDFNNRAEELMIFPTVEYDVGASLHLGSANYLAHQSAFKEGRGTSSHFTLKFKF
jgi:hypothetical protein